jgi:drug/metabolite transporter (DMT)-like permease
MTGTARWRRATVSSTQTVRAALWMLGTVASFVLMMASARELSATMSVFEILTFRCAIGLAVIAPFVLLAGRERARPRKLRLHALRNASHFVGQVGWIYGITLLPLAEVTALEFASPLWATLFAVVFLGERAGFARVLALLLGFAGVLMIVRPGSAVFSPAALIVLASTVFYATAHVMTKVLTRDDSALAIVLAMQAVQLPLALVPALFVWTTPSWSDAPWLLFMGLTGLGAHYCMARALALADASVVLPLDFLRLPCMAAVGWLAYAEVVNPWVLLGATTIFAANYWTVRREARRGRR